MSKHVYRHKVTKIESELDDNFVALFPGAFELVEKKAEKEAPVATTVEEKPAATTKKTDSSKEGNN